MVTDGTTDRTLKRAEIPRLRADMLRIRRTGRRISNSAFYLRFSPQASPDNSPTGMPQRRIAVLLPRGIKGAVRRNRLKRRLREIYRTHKDWFPTGYDYTLRATRRAVDLGFRDLLKQTEALTRRLRS